MLADADLDAAAADIAAAAFGYAGQKCTATQVVAVDTARLDPFVAALERAGSALPVGDPLDAATVVGPVIDAASAAGLRKRADAALEAAVHGWRGEAPDGDAFVAPAFAVLEDGNAELLREEVFGPVAAVVGVDSIEARTALLATSGLGLAGAVYGRDEAEIRRLANRLQVGVLAVNRPSTGLDPHVPFGGWAASGGAFAEQGTEGACASTSSGSRSTGRAPTRTRRSSEPARRGGGPASGAAPRRAGAEPGKPALEQVRAHRRRSHARWMRRRAP